VLSRDESFKNITSTPKGSIMMLPAFGSDLVEIVDKRLDYEGAVDYQATLFEAFFDEDLKPWDQRLKPLSSRIVDLNLDAQAMSIEIEFEDENIYIHKYGESL
jgi:phage baseplate assembly protein W